MRLQSEIEPNVAPVASRRASSVNRDRAFTPDEWAAQLSAPPELSSCLIDWRSALLRQWIITTWSSISGAPSGSTEKEKARRCPRSWNRVR